MRSGQNCWKSKEDWMLRDKSNREDYSRCQWMRKDAGKKKKGNLMS